jgi:adenylosuccinate lyase
MREAGAEGNDLLDRLAGEPALGLDRGQIDAALGEPLEFVGTAPQQVATVVERIERTLKAHPEAAAYTPALVL